MVIMSNTIQAGWDFDCIDSIVDNLSVGTNSSFKRNEILTKNDGDPIVTKFATKNTSNTSNTDEEGWTTTSPGKKKPKNNNNSKAASTESIITTIDGNIDQLEIGKQNRIYVTSPERKNKCNIPDDRTIEIDFHPTTLAERKEDKETVEEMDTTQGNGEEEDNNKTNGQNNGNSEENRKEKEKDNNGQDLSLIHI